VRRIDMVGNRGCPQSPKSPETVHGNRPAEKRTRLKSVTSSPARKIDVCTSSIHPWDPRSRSDLTAGLDESYLVQCQTLPAASLTFAARPVSKPCR